MVRITVDRDRCEGFGQCVFETDDVFALDENDKLVALDEVDESRRGDVSRAAEACPTQALTIE